MMEEECSVLPDLEDMKAEPGMCAFYKNR